MSKSPLTKLRSTRQLATLVVALPLTVNVVYAQDPSAEPAPTASDVAGGAQPTATENDATSPGPQGTPDEASTVEPAPLATTEAAPGPTADAPPPTSVAPTMSGGTAPIVSPQASRGGDIHDTTPDEDAQNPRANANYQPRMSFLAGYASPSGSLFTGTSVADTQTAALPLGLDFQLIGRGGFAWGLYVQFVPGFSGKGLDDCESCLTYGGRIGLEAGQHFAQRSFVDPWVTFGVGYEFLSVSSDVLVTAETSSGGLALFDGTRTTTASSLPELMIQVGMDFGDKVRVGPYGFASWGMYGSMNTEVTCDEDDCGRDVVLDENSTITFDDRRSHYWVGGGVRVSVND